MRVFISWSGNRAERVAQALGRFLGDVLAPVTPFVSSSDIEKGSRWNNEIARNLDVAGFGVVCITRDRIAAPWLNFEAGALSRSVNEGADARVATLLVDIDNPSDVPPLLGQFQSTRATRDEILKLVLSVNRVLGEYGVSVDRVNRFFEWAWPDLEAAIQAVGPATDEVADPPIATSTGLDAKLDEVIAFIRNQERRSTTHTPQGPPLATDKRRERNRRTYFTHLVQTLIEPLGVRLELLQEDPKGVILTLHGPSLPDGQREDLDAELVDAANKAGIFLSRVYYKDQPGQATG